MIFANKKDTASIDEEFDPYAEEHLRAQIGYDADPFTTDDDELTAYNDETPVEEKEEEPIKSEPKNTEIVDKNGTTYDIDSMPRGSIIQLTDKRHKYDWVYTQRFMAIHSAYEHNIWISDSGMLYDSENVAWNTRNYNYETTVIGFDKELN